MPFENLHQLLSASQSSRDYFLTLPVDLQCALHRHGDDIHTAAQLHERAFCIQELMHLEELSHHKPGHLG